MIHILRKQNLVYIGVSLIALTVLLFTIIYSLSTPQNDRNWTEDQATLARSIQQGNTVLITNIRNFSYKDEFTYTPAYYDKTFNLDEIVSVDFILVPLARFGIAHTFLSFGFANGDYVSVSVEVRKEVGEEYSAMKGLLDQYELMYVIADERDLLTLRGVYRENEVYLYPARISPERAQSLFLEVIARAEALAENPEFYNTLTNNCTTNIVTHVNAISDVRVPLDMRIILPERSDALAYELGFIGDGSTPFAELKAQSEVSARIREYADDPHFSQKIRGNE